MKILRQGKVPVKKKKIGTCSRCETVVELEEGDIQSNVQDGPYYECPTCKCWTGIISELDEEEADKVTDSQNEVVKACKILFDHYQANHIHITKEGEGYLVTYDMDGVWAKLVKE